MSELTARRLAAGDEIGARYRLERVAGTGGMATVWQARDERLQRAVAIKVLSDTLATDAAAVARFAREARTHAGIQHPNLVQVYDYSVTAPQPYLVMQYVDGVTLSERLDFGGLSPAEIQTLARELLSAMACVHDHGVLHRDIKPANVLIDNDGCARLTDFGLARIEESSQVTPPGEGEVVGTLRFLAPELIQGQPATRQSDLFALGVLLRTATGVTIPLPETADLIGWLTEPDPHARPPDAHAAMSVLYPMNTARTRSGSALRTARPPRTGSPSRRPRPRRPVPGGRDVRLRNRLIAVSALAAATATTAVIAVDASASSQAPVRPAATRPAATRPAAARRAATDPTATTRAHHVTYTMPAAVDQDLRRLAASVRRAARP